MLPPRTSRRACMRLCTAPCAAGNDGERRAAPSRAPLAAEMLAAVFIMPPSWRRVVMVRGARDAADGVRCVS